MSIDEAINVFRKMKTLPSQCHLNWLKENFNPILKQMDDELVMNWGCGNCVKNYMNMLIGWQDRKIKAEQQKPKPKPKRKRTNVKKNNK
jgi:hypothetical protein